MTEKASYMLMPVSQSKPRAEQEPFAPNWFVWPLLALVWFNPVLASVKGCWRGLQVNHVDSLVSYASNHSPKSTLHQLNLPYIAPTPFPFTFHRSVHCTNSFAQNGQGYLRGIFVKEFCYNSGNHGSVWANFCSPSKTRKRVQISIKLPKRPSKNMQLLKEPAFYVKVN